MTLVKEVMRRRFKKLKLSDPVKKAVSLLLNNPESAMPVIDSKGKVVGEVHQRDLLLFEMDADYMPSSQILGPRALKQLLRSTAKTVKELMRPIGASVRPSDDVKLAIHLLYDQNQTQIPVIDKGKMVGVVTEIDILKKVKKEL